MSNEIKKIITTEFGTVDWDVYTDEAFDDEGNEIEGEVYAKIDNLFVKEEFRGNGFARELITLALKEIEKLGFSGAKIVPEPQESDVDLTRLACFYESMGLEVVAV